jgi:hypothetical protein
MDSNRSVMNVLIAAGVAGLGGLLIYWFLGGAKPPQMGPDEEVFKTVDALFTAVTARDEVLLLQCEGRLQNHKDAGKLPVAASDHLDAIIQSARAGSWETAAQRLYDFMRAQRREGTSQVSTRETQ